MLQSTEIEADQPYDDDAIHSFKGKWFCWCPMRNWDQRKTVGKDEPLLHLNREGKFVGIKFEKHESVLWGLVRLSNDHLGVASYSLWSRTTHLLETLQAAESALPAGKNAHSRKRETTSGMLRYNLRTDLAQASSFYANECVSENPEFRDSLTQINRLWLTFVMFTFVCFPFGFNSEWFTNKIDK